MKMLIRPRARGWLAAVAATLMLAGCGGGGEVPPQDMVSTGDATGAANDSGHPTATTEDTGVVVVPYGAGYLATRTITMVNDATGATRGVVVLDSQLGDVTTSPGAAEYQVTIALQATGPTEADARKAISTMTVSQSDSMRGGTLYLTAKVNAGAYQSPHGSISPVPGVNVGNVNADVRGASIHAVLPATLTYSLSQSTQVGNASATGLSGTSANLESQVGDAVLDGLWTKVALTSQVGNVSFTGDAGSIYAESQAGSAYGVLAPQHDVNGLFVSQVGGVDVSLAGPATGGFDLYAQTQVGTATIVVHGTQPMGKPSPFEAHWQTPGYASMSPKVHIEGYSQVGSVDIHD